MQALPYSDLYVESPEFWCFCSLSQNPLYIEHLYFLGPQGEYFYGTTELGKGGKRVFTLKPKHSLLMFRGKMFEWGFGTPKTYRMDRNPAQCSISWEFVSKGMSKCRLDQIEQWTQNYPNLHGGYQVTTNNCHYFVNRLMEHLKTNCVTV